MRRPTLRTVVVRSIQVLVIGVATWRLAIPQAPAAWSALSALGGTPLTPIAIAAACAFAAWLAYAQLLRVAMGEAESPGLWHTFGITSTTLGISNVLPGGSAVGSVVGLRMLERAGVSRSRAVVSMAVTSLGSAVVLSIMLELGLIALAPTRGFASGAFVILPVAVLTGVVIVITRAIVRGDGSVFVVADRLGRRFPNKIGGRIVAALNAVGDQVGEWRAEPARVRRAVIWAVLNWLADVAALYAVLYAVGVVVNPLVVLVAFALANIAAMIPITPGGLGVVELAMAATIVGFGAAAAPVALGVAMYRLFNYWAPIPISVVAWAATTAATRHVPRCVRTPAVGAIATG